ncbi:hypothetical protein GCM10028798_32540 [Humibacter antri]
MKHNDTLTDKVFAQLTGQFEPWLSCDDCFEHSDSVLENLLDRGVPLPAEFRAHLRGCAACRDEMETLAELIAENLHTAARAKLDAQIAVE